MFAFIGAPERSQLEIYFQIQVIFIQKYPPWGQAEFLFVKYPSIVRNRTRRAASNEPMFAFVRTLERSQP